MFHLKNSSARIVKIAIVLIIGLISSFSFYNLPWHPPIEINFKDYLGIPIEIKIEKSDKSVRSHLFIPTEEKPTITFLASKVLSISQPSVEKEIIYKTDNHKQKLFLKKGFTEFPEQLSARSNKFAILEACIIGAVLLSLLVWNFLENISWPLSPRFKKKSLMLGVHVLTMGCLLWTNLPGFLGWDSFEYFSAAGYYSASTFIGDIHISVLMLLFQIFPEMWLMSALNAMVIVFCLTIISNIAIELGTFRFYILGLLIFSLYPVNAVLSLYAVRDISCFWILVTTLLLYYYSYLVNDKSFGTFLMIGTGTVLTCLMRQESLFIFLPGIILISFFMYKAYFKKTLIMGAAVLLSSYLISIINPPQMDFFTYQTTLIVNPLSYILKAKYPNGLPEEVNQELGKYFKNDYLITYQQNNEIMPFHKGGINPGTTEVDFRQFRKTAVKIILNNPVLFLENRLIMVNYLLGLDPSWNYVFSDDFYHIRKDRPYFFDEVMQKLSIDQNDYSRPELTKKSFKYLSSLLYDYRIVLTSYIIPIVMLFSFLFLRPFSFFYASLLALIGSRTILVWLSAPAGYFKYFYPLWIFAPFVLCLLMAERKLRLTKAQ